MAGLFDTRAPSTRSEYTAKDIEVLEGLEPVRRRPAMYIGGTDERALHHLVAELLDNAMDEAVAGHASFIDLELADDGGITVRDNGRGIPVDPHPKIKKKSALEVILTTLHAGGKFTNKVYQTAGGLHGVGLSVVNALSERLVVEVARDKNLWRQSYKCGEPDGPLKNIGTIKNRRGTSVTCYPDPKIFPNNIQFRPDLLYRMARSKAYLFRGIEIRWRCHNKWIQNDAATPSKATLTFPGGLKDFLLIETGNREMVTSIPFSGEAKLAKGGRVEWAVSWPSDDGTSFLHSYCNTVPTPDGGSHESGFRTALTRGLKAYGELAKVKRANQITADDILTSTCGILSVFISEPQFQGQTKERLNSPEAAKWVEACLKDHFEHWLTQDPELADTLLSRVLERVENRLRRRQERDVKRQSATRRLRLPGKLSDCTLAEATGTEIFLVEGDSAGGSAKSARDRKTQAVFALRGKVLNVMSATTDKLRGNKELSDLVLALGCGTRENYSSSKLRYERVVIMTDADVDGAHIASLLMTFFYCEMPKLISEGHLFLAQPPLYRLNRGANTEYAQDDTHLKELLSMKFKGKVDVSRFKGLGEMPPAQLKSTTMAPSTRTLLQITDNTQTKQMTAQRVEALMGRSPEHRLSFIQEHAKFFSELDV
ncbi:MAG: DNA gyrase subunit B [Alphaproteobacteria bacterium MarineAlpha9_Bin7]|nr:MAG: DNA gyrase subunit B [Alphaproteobacteria bacterium MarineAlpha9_Bin7]